MKKDDDDKKKKSVAFKASSSSKSKNKGKAKKKESIDEECSNDDSDDEALALFVRKFGKLMKKKGYHTRKRRDYWIFLTSLPKVDLVSNSDNGDKNVKPIPHAT